MMAGGEDENGAGREGHVTRGDTHDEVLPDETLPGAWPSPYGAKMSV
jgi:hypothetical protein